MITKTITLPVSDTDLLRIDFKNYLKEQLNQSPTPIVMSEEEIEKKVDHAIRVYQRRNNKGKIGEAYFFALECLIKNLYYTPEDIVEESGSDLLAYVITKHAEKVRETSVSIYLKTYMRNRDIYRIKRRNI
ncbi:MAG: hypothetical protein LUF90_08970 [Rikenellaceae bacterium]|nr:hypothetical protein [Rikenellaceae bacterium]